MEAMVGDGTNEPLPISLRVVRLYASLVVRQTANTVGGKTTRETFAVPQFKKTICRGVQVGQLTPSPAYH